MQKFLLSVLCGALAIFTINNTQAYTFYNSNNTGALDINARIALTYQAASEEYNTFAYKGLKPSFLMLSPYANFGSVQIGGTYANRWLYYLPKKYQHSKTANTFIFIQSPKFGKTSIGKTRGIYEDFMLESQNFKNSLTSYIPALVEYNHSRVYKYTSGLTRYYNYGGSYVRTKTDNGHLKQVAAFLTYQIPTGDDSYIKASFLSTYQRYIEHNLIEYRTYPNSLRISLVYSDLYNIRFAPYLIIEEVKLLARQGYVPWNKVFRLENFGGYLNNEITLTDNIIVYSGLSVHYKINSNDTNITTTDGTELAAKERREMYLATLGLRYHYSKCFEVHGEVQAQKFKSNIHTYKKHTQNLLQLGAVIRF